MNVVSDGKYLRSQYALTPWKMLNSPTSMKNARYTSTVNWNRFMRSNQSSATHDINKEYSYDARASVALLIVQGRTPLLDIVAITSVERDTVHSSPKLIDAVTSLLRPGVIW